MFGISGCIAKFVKIKEIMAKHKTKAQKLKIAAKKQEFSQAELVQTSLAETVKSHSGAVSWTADSTINSSSLKKPILTQPSLFNWRFSPSLIYQDLLKTGLASLLIVGILLLIYYLSFSR